MTHFPLPSGQEFWYTVMISQRSHHPRAFYDADGNIRVVGDAPPAAVPTPHEQPRMTRRAQGAPDAAQMPTTTPPANPAPMPQALAPERVNAAWVVTDEAAAAVGRDIRESVYALTHIGWRESCAQYRSGLQELGAAARAWRRGAVESGARLRNFLLQPVWIPSRRAPAKQRSRLALFCTDVVRFGVTFSMIFGGLFLALNHQSFLAIISSRLDPLMSVEAADRLSTSLGKPPVAAEDIRERGNLLALLPDMGPPHNRIIIPKLGLNVPIVIPPSDALLAEDWPRLESEIQHGLQSGVVHYPGTARPGQAGNFFVTGHSSYYPWAPGAYKSVFARLGELDVGDEYWVYYGNDKHRYRIADKKEVLPSDVSVLDQPGDKRLSTLMTCTPVGTTLRRLVLQAEELDPLSGERLAVGQHTTRPENTAPRMDFLPI